MIIESVMIKYLEEKLGVNVYADMPAKRPQKFIVLDKIDGGQINHINASTLSVYSYAESIAECAKLHELVKEALLDAIEIDDITSSKIGSERRDTDLTYKLPRYEVIINLYHY